jgi:hypothetical protein
MIWQKMTSLLRLKGGNIYPGEHGCTHSKVERATVEFPPNESTQIAIKAQIEAYKAIFAPELAASQVMQINPKIAKSLCNPKSKATLQP